MKARPPILSGFLVFACVLPLGGCGDGGVGPGDAPPEKPAPPPPGPNFSVVPIDTALISWISPLGNNNKIFPVAHTYWVTCQQRWDHEYPCHWGQQPLRAPATGVILSVHHAADGSLRAEGPPGLQWHFGHVTPAPGLSVGFRFTAGEVIATTYGASGFDFGMINYGIERRYVAQHRYNDGYLHGQHPIQQYPEPLRSRLMARMWGVDAGLGRLEWDQEGTAAGYGYIQGAPQDHTVLEGDKEHLLLYLGRYTERPAVRIVSVGQRWPAMPSNQLIVDPAHPSWEEITVAAGPINLRLWLEGWYLLPSTGDHDDMGTLRVHLFHPDSIRVEWFDTHGEVTGFTPAARVYTR